MIDLSVMPHDVLARMQAGDSVVGSPRPAGGGDGHQGARLFGYGANAAAARLDCCGLAYFPFFSIFATFGARMRCTLGNPEPRSGRP